MNDNALKLLSRIEKLLPITTKPSLINQLINDLKLENLETKDQEFCEFITKVRVEKVDLRKITQHVKKALLDNEPLCNLLGFIEDKGLISDAELQNLAATLEKQLHLLCLFEAMLVTMTNSKEFAKEIYDHLVKLNGNPFPGNPLADFFLGSLTNATIFERLKLLSIKPVMLSIIFHRLMSGQIETQEALDEFIRDNALSGFNTWIEPAKSGVMSGDTIPVMGLNILEALWGDLTGPGKDHGGKENADSGVLLIQTMEQKYYPNQCNYLPMVLPEGTQLKQDGRYELLPELKVDTSKKLISQFFVDREWRDLYTSWNLFFVLLNIDTAVMPLKLLLPTVMTAEAPNYKEVRILSLFLIGSLFLYVTKNNPKFPNTKLENSELIFEEWGKMNKEYATSLLHKFCPEVPDTAKSSVDEVFGYHTHLNFFKHLFNFARDSKHYRFTSFKTSGPQFFAPASSTVKNLDTMESLPEEKSVGSNPG